VHDAAAPVLRVGVVSRLGAKDFGFITATDCANPEAYFFFLSAVQGGALLNKGDAVQFTVDPACPAAPGREPRALMVRRLPRAASLQCPGRPACPRAAPAPGPSLPLA
jgi:cold shock CspA family protein